ncbi:MAG: YfdX family protein [Nitrospirales bacterium]
MKKKPLVLVAMGILFFGQAVFAEIQGQQNPKETVVVSSLEKQSLATVMEIHKMMGYINLAYLALDIDLPRDATNHINKAKGIADRLKGDVPSLMGDSTLKYGKVSFTSQDTTKNYYVPVLDDLFLLSEYDTVYRHLQSIDLKQTNAGVVGLNILVDLRKIAPALETTIQDLNKKNYQKAQTALAKIFIDAIVEEAVITDPRLAIYHNLALANNFIQNGLYPSARSTLKNVKKGLAQLEKEKMGSPHAQLVEALSQEITQLDVQLEQNDPTLMRRVGGQFSAWMKIVKSGF